jgi:hypothetical protein
LAYNADLLDLQQKEVLAVDLRVDDDDEAAIQQLWTVVYQFKYELDNEKKEGLGTMTRIENTCDDAWCA